MKPLQLETSRRRVALLFKLRSESTGGLDRVSAERSSSTIRLGAPSRLAVSPFGQIMESVKSRRSDTTTERESPMASSEYGPGMGLPCQRIPSGTGQRQALGRRGAKATQ